MQNYSNKSERIWYTLVHIGSRACIYYKTLLYCFGRCLILTKVFRVYSVHFFYFLCSALHVIAMKSTRHRGDVYVSSRWHVCTIAMVLTCLALREKVYYCLLSVLALRLYLLGFHHIIFVFIGVGLVHFSTFDALENF